MKVFIHHFKRCIRNKDYKLALAIANLCKEKVLAIGLKNSVRFNHNVHIPADSIPSQIKKQLITANKKIASREKRWENFLKRYHQFYFKLVQKHILDVPKALQLISQTKDEMVLKVMMGYLATHAPRARSFYIRK